MTDLPIVLNADAIAARLQHVDVLDEMRKLFTELGQKKAVQPQQTITLFPEGRGDFITYLGAQSGAGVFGAKLSPYLVTNSKPIITAWTLLLSMETGEPVLLCDSGELTKERTAATTALAVDFLASKKASCLAIIGSGAVALAHWQHVANLRDWNEVRVYSPNLSASKENRRIWQDHCPTVSFPETSEQGIEGADVVMLCTSSGTPVVDANHVGTNTLVTSISTNVAQAHEIDPAYLASAQVYCDYRETTPFSAGEMVLAARDHDWHPSDILGDLAELSTNACPSPDPNRPVFFRSIGLGLEDTAIAAAIYRAASA